MSIRILRCNDEDARAWDQYLLENPYSNFYQRYAWKDINKKCFGHQSIYLAAEKNDIFVGLLPIVFINSHVFGKILSSMPFVNFGGLSSNSDEICELLVDEADNINKHYNADYLEIRSTNPINKTLPTNTHKVSMTLDLDPDSEKVWDSFKSKHRTNIRRVYKENITVRHGRHELLDTFYKLMSHSWRAHGTPIYRKSYYRHILDAFPDEVLIFVAYHGNEPVATAFNGYYKDTVEGMWAGTMPTIRNSLQPNYVLYWEMIKHACENGFKHFHLGRSTVDSDAESFKKKWNAYPKQLHWQYLLNNTTSMPQLNVNNPKYALAIKLWRKIPIPLTTIFGHYIARNIP